MSRLTELGSWRALREHRAEMESFRLREAFESDPDRFRRFSLSPLHDFLVDCSKNLVAERTVDLLVRLAEEAGLHEAIAAVFRGDKINTTERRAAFHVARGVELGKELAGKVLEELRGRAPLEGHDASTASLIEWVRRRGGGRREEAAG